MITSLSKDTSVSNAIAMTIEALPTGQSRALRQLVNSFERYCDWVEDWEPKGWTIEATGSQVALEAPPGSDWAELCCYRRKHPSNEVVAAAAGVSSVKFNNVRWLAGRRIVITFLVTR
jgi:hypothetical protein